MTASVPAAAAPPAPQLMLFGKPLEHYDAGVLRFRVAPQESGITVTPDTDAARAAVAQPGGAGGRLHDFVRGVAEISSDIAGRPPERITFARSPAAFAAAMLEARQHGGDTPAQLERWQRRLAGHSFQETTSAMAPPKNLVFGPIITGPVEQWTSYGRWNSGLDRVPHTIIHESMHHAAKSDGVVIGSLRNAWNEGYAEFRARDPKLEQRAIKALDLPPDLEVPPTEAYHGHVELVERAFEHAGFDLTTPAKRQAVLDGIRGASLFSLTDSLAARMATNAGVPDPSDDVIVDTIKKLVSASNASDVDSIASSLRPADPVGSPAALR